MRLTGRVLAAALISICSAPAVAQNANPFADPQNLKVLQEDISPEGLRALMRDFSFSTGIRCSGCHVPTEGAPLNEWDFAADDKEQKRIAREMIRMVMDINKTVASIDDVDPNEMVRVRCMTCHRGIERPLLIQDELDAFKAAGDAAGAATRYRELREIYYGTHSYDFSPFTLAEYAETATREGENAFGYGLHALNREINPEDAYVYIAWGNSLSAEGRLDEALDAYRRGAALEPENEFYAGLVQRAEAAIADER